MCWNSVFGASLRERDRMQRIGIYNCSYVVVYFPLCDCPRCWAVLAPGKRASCPALCAPTVISTPCTGLSLWSIPPSIYIQIPEMTPESGLEKALLDFQIGPPLWLRAYASSYGCSS